MNACRPETVSFPIPPSDADVVRGPYRQLRHLRHSYPPQIAPRHMPTTALVTGIQKSEPSRDTKRGIGLRPKWRNPWTFTPCGSWIRTLAGIRPSGKLRLSGLRHQHDSTPTRVKIVPKKGASG